MHSLWKYIENRFVCFSFFYPISFASLKKANTCKFNYFRCWVIILSAPGSTASINFTVNQSYSRLIIIKYICPIAEMFKPKLCMCRLARSAVSWENIGIIINHDTRRMKKYTIILNKFGIKEPVSIYSQSSCTSSGCSFIAWSTLFSSTSIVISIFFSSWFWAR